MSTVSDKLHKIASAYGVTVETDSPLMREAGRLIQAHDEHEAERFEREQSRRTFTAVEQIQLRQAAHALSQPEYDTDIPVAMSFDVYCMIKDASKENPTDRGLKLASTYLYRKWSQDYNGALTVGEIDTLRKQFMDEHPKSRLANTLDTHLARVAFRSLTDIPLILRTASQLRSQEDYENACVNLGIDGNKPEQIRARAALSAFSEYVDTFNQEAHTSEDVERRALTRLALGEPMEPEMPVGPQEDASFVDEDPMAEDPAHPHLDSEEILGEIESPVSGETLVVELAPKKEEIDPFQHDEMEPSVTQPHQSLPDTGSMEHAGQLQDFAQEEPEAESELGLNDPNVENDLPTEDVEEPEQETTALVTDPTSGEELEMTLRVVQEEDPTVFDEDVSQIPENGSEPGPMPDTDLPAMPSMTDQKQLQAFLVYATSAGVTAQEPIDSFKARSLQSALARIANFGVSGEVYVNPRALSREAVIDLGDDSYLHIYAAKDPYQVTPIVSHGPKMTVPKDGGDLLRADSFTKSKDDKEEKKPKKKLNAGQIQRICARIGITASVIEENLLNGETVECDTWKLAFNTNDELELTKSASKPVNYAAVHLDKAVLDFQAAVAHEAAAKWDEEDESHVVTTFTANIPRGTNLRDLRLNAKRVLNAVRKVSETAKGILNTKSASMRIETHDISPRAVNRIERVLKDTFKINARVKQRVGQSMPGYMLDPSGTPQIMMPPGQAQPGQVQPEDNRAPGTDTFDPMQPMKMQEMQNNIQNKSDPAQAGTQQQNQFMQDHANPMQPGKMGQMMPPMPAANDEDMGAEDLAVEDASMDEASLEAANDEPSGMPVGGPDQGEMEMQSPLDEEAEAAVHAAIMHFRNQNLPVIEALTQFRHDYSEFLERYGDEDSPERHLSEAAVVRIAGEVYSKPALIQRAANMVETVRRIYAWEAKKVNTQQPSAVSGDMTPGTDTTEKEMKGGPKGKPSTSVIPKGKKPDAKMTSDTSGNAANLGGVKSFGGDPQKGSQEKNKGTKFPKVDTKNHKGEDGNGDNSATKHMDSLSKSAPGTIRSK